MSYTLNLKAPIQGCVIEVDDNGSRFLRYGHDCRIDPGAYSIVTLTGGRPPKRKTWIGNGKAGFWEVDTEELQANSVFQAASG